MMLRARPALSNDVEFLWSMLIYAASIDERPAPAVESIRNRYLHNWGRPGDLGLIASDAERPIGAAWLRLPIKDETHSAAFVANDVPELAIAVEPDRIGQGVGSFLLDRLLGQADRNEVPATVLSTRADNPAVRLYRRFGFVETGRIANPVGASSVKMIRRRDPDRDFNDPLSMAPRRRDRIAIR